MMGWFGIRRLSGLSKISVDEHLVGVDQQIVRNENNLVRFSAPKRSLRTYEWRIDRVACRHEQAAAPESAETDVCAALRQIKDLIGGVKLIREAIPIPSGTWVWLASG